MKKYKFNLDCYESKTTNDLLKCKEPNSVHEKPNPNPNPNLEEKSFKNISSNAAFKVKCKQLLL